MRTVLRRRLVPESSAASSLAKGRPKALGTNRTASTGTPERQGVTRSDPRRASAR